jgi:hypothetical protein
MGGMWGKRIHRRRMRLPAEHAGQRKAAEAAGRLTEHLATGWEKR